MLLVILSICPMSICLLTPILCDMVAIYLVEGFQWNLTQIFIIWAGIAEKIFKVKGQWVVVKKLKGMSTITHDVGCVLCW